MQDEFKAYQDAISQVGTAAAALNDARAKLHAAIDQKAADIGKQVATDTAVKVSGAAAP